MGAGDIFLLLGLCLDLTLVFLRPVGRALEGNAIDEHVLEIVHDIVIDVVNIVGKNRGGRQASTPEDISECDGCSAFF